MRYKVFTRADLGCPFLTENDIPDKYKTERAARKFCANGCCPVCTPLFWWVRVLGQTERSAPWYELDLLVMDPKRIVLLPISKEEVKA